MIFVKSSLIDIKVSRSDVKAYYIPCNEIAAKLGNSKVAGNVMLGAFIAATGAVSIDDVMTSLSYTLKNKQHLMGVNRQALETGEELISK